MASTLLTDRQIRNAKPIDKEYYLSDGSGLYLRIRPNGSKLWMLRYTGLDKRQKKKSLGKYPDVSLAVARQEALILRAGLAKGIDPQSLNLITPKTVNDLFKIWIKKDIPLRREPRGAYRLKKRLEKHILPYIGQDSISSITRPRALRVLRQVVSLGQNAQANMLLRDLRQMFDYAVAHEWLEFNRISTIKLIEVGGRDAIGERFLKPAEVTELWNKCHQKTGITIQCFASIWIGISTMARIEEMLTMQEQEINKKDMIWTIPAEKNKSKREHIVHLSPFAFKIIEMLINTPRDGSSYLFKSNRTDSYTKPNTLNFQIAHRQDGIEKHDQNSRLSDAVRSSLRLSGGRWSHHDLRRTGATLMGQLGIAENIIEMCLNHAKKDLLIKTYQKQSYLDERKSAFYTLGAEIDRLTKSNLTDTL